MTKMTLTLLLVLMTSGLVHAQYINVDFEPTGIGADWGWTVGENGDNPALEVVANPAVGGANPSANVAKFTARQSGQPWALCFTDDMEPFQFTTANTTISIMVYKPVVSNIGLKFEGAGAPVEIQVPNTLVNQWETVTFDFSAYVGSSYSRLIIIPDFVARPTERMIYFDNIQLPQTNVDPVPEPESPAPTPAYDPGDVVSLFSNAYTNSPVDTWSASWDQADVSDVQIEGNDNKLYTNVTFAGIEFTSTTLDATNMEYFHIDLWTPNDTASPTVFRVKLVDFGADGAWSGGDDVEHELTFGSDVLATEAWVGIDVPLADFTGLVTRGHLAQLIFSGDLNTFYIDNIYFRGSGAGPATPTIAAPTPAHPANDVISMFSDAYTNVTVDTWSAPWDMANVSDIVIQGNNTKMYTALTHAGIEFITHQINASEMEYFHMDIWTPDVIADTTEFKVKLVDFGADGAWSGGDDSEHELVFGTGTLVSETWIALDIPLTAFTGLTARNHLAQLIISGDPNTVYVDNVYFHGVAQDTDDETVPGTASFVLAGNYPNPFNPETTIRFSMSHQAQVSLKVYDIRGRLVEILVNGQRQAGDHEVVWKADQAASGVYFYALSVGGQPVGTKRMILLK